MCGVGDGTQALNINAIEQHSHTEGVFEGRVRAPVQTFKCTCVREEIVAVGSGAIVVCQDKNRGDLQEIPKPLNAFLIFLTALEGRWIRRWPLPWGSSLLILGRKV